jgi:hypothetical protein
MYNDGMIPYAHGMNEKPRSIFPQRVVDDGFGMIPICSMHGMHGIFTNICPTNHPNVDRYTIHGAYGIWFHQKMGMPRYPNNHPKEESPRGHPVVSVQLVGTCP